MDVLDSGMWSTVTEGVLGKYCQARDPTLILANQENDKFAITHDLDLEAGDVIQFRVIKFQGHILTLFQITI